MRWVAIFEDKTGALAIRDAHQDAHVAYLVMHRHHIRLAGGLRDEPGDPPQGGLWIMDNIADRAEAVRLCENDPFFIAGLRASYRLQAWGYAPCYEDVVL